MLVMVMQEEDVDNSTTMMGRDGDVCSTCGCAIVVIVIIIL